MHELWLEMKWHEIESLNRLSRDIIRDLHFEMSQDIQTKLGGDLEYVQRYAAVKSGIRDKLGYCVPKMH